MFENKSDIEILAKAFVVELIDSSRSKLKNGECDYSDGTLVKLERVKQSGSDWGIESSPVKSADLDQKSNMFRGVSYRSLSNNWLMGNPDRGSGTSAGKHLPEPMNLIQFSQSDAFLWLMYRARRNFST